MILLQFVAVLAISVSALLLARHARLLDTDMARLMMVASIALLVSTMPVFAAMPYIDRLLAMIVGGAALYFQMRCAFGPVRYRVLQQVPVLLLEARRGSYRMRSQMRYRSQIAWYGA